MINKLTKYFRKFLNRRRYEDINPDEIFIDSKNLPDFDLNQFEGRLGKPISHRVFTLFWSLCLLVGFVFILKLWNLQIMDGKFYAEKSQNNSLHYDIIFASRGVIYDRNGKELVWNITPSSTRDFPKRDYIRSSGFGHLLGFVKYPAKDSSGFYYRENYEPMDGLELSLDDKLGGKNGLQITETDVASNIVSQSLIDKEISGEKVTLSIDFRLQEKLYQNMASLAERVGFKGGAGIIMDIYSGEIIAMTNFPEYSSQFLTEGNPEEKIQEYSTGSNMPFLNRAVSGLYTPGSIVKPFIAFAALEENIIDPSKQIVSQGKLIIPNPYFPDQPSVFLDWKAHGATDMRHAIAVSSDVYFYEIGGGFEDQKGLGILNIKKYLEKFGFGKITGINIGEEGLGNIPDPEWKMKIFGEDWRLGDTYHTVIGQYGMQVTPMQVIRAISAIANGGTLITPNFLKQLASVSPVGEKVGGDAEHYKIIQEGMRLSTTEGTSIGLNVPFVHIAGKTGTAELGIKKDLVNSWTIGFFPYENPRYAYTIVMEKGPVKNLTGATFVMRSLIDWMSVNTPEYFITSPLTPLLEAGEGIN